MNAEIERLLAKARRSLAVAQQLVEQGDCDFGATRAYYAIFYLATAMLMTRQKSASKHSAVIAMFGQEFVARGGFSRDHHATLRRAFELRNIGDYSAALQVSEADARDLLDRATRFVTDAEAFLRRAAG